MLAHVVVASIILGAEIISNLFTAVLTVFIIFCDIDASPQGVDYYILSLAVSDLILGFLLSPLSLFSLSHNVWIFGRDTCEYYAHLWYLLWLTNAYNYLLLSVDRLLYVTDKKYVEYKNRTRVRCICEIFLAWTMAILFSCVPAIFYRKHLTSVLVDQYVCSIEWYETRGYFASVLLITVMPSLFGSMFNFLSIFYWRIQYGMHKMKRQLKAASVGYLCDPTHRMSLIMFLVFWLSWIPFGVHIYRCLSDKMQTPSFFAIYLGKSEGVWRFPIMMLFCPRYRQYMAKFFGNKCRKKSDINKSILEETNEERNFIRCPKCRLRHICVCKF